MLGDVGGRGRGRAKLLENGPPAPLRRPRARTSVAAAAGGAGEPAAPAVPQLQQQLRRPGVPSSAAAAAAVQIQGGQEAAAPPAAAWPVSVPGMNPYSASFVPSALPADAATATPDFSEWGSDTEPEPEGAVNTALVTEIPPPLDDYQGMIYNNIAEALWNMACVPASFDRHGTVLVENLNGWLPSSDIPLSTVLDFMMNQVAYVPAFRYVCAKLCHLMCCRCRVTQDGHTFRDLLLSRCQSLFQNAGALLAEPESVPFFCELTVLFCELYLQVRLAGGEEPIVVLGSAVLGLCSQLLDDVTPERVTAVCQALKLTGAALERQVAPALDALMERVRHAAFDGRLPRDERYALLELTTLRAAHWGMADPAGGRAQPGTPQAEISRPLQGYLPADPASGLSNEECHFLEQQLQATDDDEDDELDDAYDAYLEELDRRR